MPKLESIDAPSVLGITEQQLNLLKIVYKLTSKNKVATPREIELSYAKDHAGEIQTSNLFRQLKNLLDKQFLTREGEANYKLNFEGIKKTLDTRKQEYHTKLQQYEQLTNQLEEYFRQVTTTAEKPVVEYFENRYFSERMLKALEKATAYYSTTSFPNITYGFGIADTIGRRSYVEVLNKRALLDKNLDLYYLTDLNVEYLYNHINKKIPDHQKCHRHCVTIIDQLEGIIADYDNINISYQQTPLYLDVHIPESRDEPLEYFSHVRGSRSELLGVLYIKSHEIARQNKELFMSLFGEGVKLTRDNSKNVFEKVREELGVRYGK